MLAPCLVHLSVRSIGDVRVLKNRDSLDVIQLTEGFPHDRHDCLPEKVCTTEAIGMLHSTRHA
jgi:hypothetical protein